MTATKTYEILTSAPFVAGIRSPGFGRFLELTDEQAQYPIITGHIRASAPAPATGEAEANAESFAPAKTTRRTKG